MNKSIIILSQKLPKWVLFIALTFLFYTSKGQGNLSLVGPVHFNSNITIPFNLRIVQFDTIVIPQNHIFKIEQNTVSQFFQPQYSGFINPNFEPIVSTSYHLTIEITGSNITPGSVLAHTINYETISRTPMWLGSGTYYLKIHREHTNFSQKEFYHHSMHGLLFTLN